MTVRQAKTLALALVLGTVASYAYAIPAGFMAYYLGFPGEGLTGTLLTVLCYIGVIPMLPAFYLGTVVPAIVGHVTNAAVWIILGYCYLWLRRRDRSRRDRGSGGL